MKISKNSLKNKVVFRCDAANNPKVGTGHLIRCLNLAKHLSIRYKIKQKNIIFICKTENEFYLSKELLAGKKFSLKKINYLIKDNSIEEAKFISKYPANLLVIDRVSDTNLNFYNLIKNIFKKKIIFEDKSKYRNKFDLSINSLTFKKSFYQSKKEKIGFKYMLLPITSKKENPFNRKNNIFLSFGGYDHNNLCMKILKILPQIKKDLQIFIPKVYKLNKFDKSIKHNLKIYKKNEYLKYFKQCNIAIISGGLTLFEAIYLKKKIICVPQYRHQLINAKKMKKYYPINIIENDHKNFQSILINKINKIYGKKVNLLSNKIKKNNIISHENYVKTLSYIEKIYEKSFN